MSDSLRVSNWRFYTIGAVLLAMLLALVVKIVSLQLIAETQKGFVFLQKEGDARAVREVTIPAHRGMITDRNGEPLAVSTPVVSVWTKPNRFEFSDSEVATLADLLDMRATKLKKMLSAPRDFVFLKRQLPPALGKKILDAKIAGVFLQDDYRRFYPAGEVAAHVVGLTDVDDRGREGMELAFDDFLTGTPGKKKVLKSLNGKIIRNIEEIESGRPGNDVALSIDLRLQYVAYRELKKAVETYEAKAGSVVMLDAISGEVLAMVNQPSHNPNNRSAYNPHHVRNRAMTDVFEPGSTIKPLSMLAAFETGRYTPRTLIDTNPGYMVVEGKTFPDPVNYGLIDLTKVISKSSQVGMSKIAIDVGNEPVRDLLLAMGFGESTVSGFPGESPGIFPDKKRRPATGIETANMAFGYGFATTAIQLAQAYAILANNGVRIPVTMMRNGSTGQSERIISASNARKIRAMLETVVSEEGTGRGANLASYSVAGKTGTAHKVGAQGYEDRYRALFAGMAPSDDPRIVTVVVIDEPAGEKYHGGQVAAPVFADVMGPSLRLYNVVPDKAVQQLAEKRSQQGARS